MTLAALISRSSRASVLGVDQHDIVDRIEPRSAVVVTWLSGVRLERDGDHRRTGCHYQGSAPGTSARELGGVAWFERAHVKNVTGVTANQDQIERNRHRPAVALAVHRDRLMQLNAMKAAASALARSVGAVRGYVTTKQCWRCRRRLTRRAIVCTHCGKWQG